MMWPQLLLSAEGEAASTASELVEGYYFGEAWEKATQGSKRTYFPSTCIEWIEYNEESEELRVMFAGRRGSSPYVYSGVPLSVVDGFETAASAGGYYNSMIKGQY
jgi:hypothetical protein